MLEIRLFCSSIIAVPSGPKSHTITVILAVVAPQPRWRHKPWKGVLSLEGTFWLILLCLMQLFTIWYSQAKVTGSQHNSTPTPQKLMVYNLPPLFPLYPSATFLSSCMSPPCVMLCNMKKRGQIKKFLRKGGGSNFGQFFAHHWNQYFPCLHAVTFSLHDRDSCFDDTQSSCCVLERPSFQTIVFSSRVKSWSNFERFSDCIKFIMSYGWKVMSDASLIF